MRRYGTVQDQRQAVKGPDRQDWLTSGELCRMLGVQRPYLNQLVARGVIPFQDAVAENGWRLWSPASARAALEYRMRRKSVR